jgi:hypothetical protein
MRKITIREAEDECAETKVKCATCTDVRLEGERYCRSCRDYWADVANGIYEHEEIWL